MATPRVSVEELGLRLPDYVDVDPSTYVGMKKICRFVDREYGEFWSVPSDVCKGHGHRMRANEKISKSKSTKLSDIESMLPDFITIDRQTYINKQVKARFIDADYGDFWATPKNVLNGHCWHRSRMIEEKRNVKFSVKEVADRLPSHIIIKEDTFTNTANKAVFVDCEYGEWVSTPNQVMFGSEHPKRALEDRKKTNLERYGVPYAMQNREIFRKSQSSMRKSRTLNHWKTGEELVCVGSYELAVVTQLNKNRIDFSWQIPFSLSDGSVYYCDLYICELDLYVEIKGWWMQELSKKKWEEFHAENKNSELWDRHVLIEKGFDIK